MSEVPVRLFLIRETCSNPGNSMPCAYQVEERKLCESLNGLAAQLSTQAAELGGSDSVPESPRRRTASKMRKLSNPDAVPSGHDDEVTQNAGDDDASPPASPGAHCCRTCWGVSVMPLSGYDVCVLLTVQI